MNSVNSDGEKYTNWVEIGGKTKPASPSVVTVMTAKIEEITKIFTPTKTIEEPAVPERARKRQAELKREKKDVELMRDEAPEGASVTRELKEPEPAGFSFFSTMKKAAGKDSTKSKEVEKAKKKGEKKKMDKIQDAERLSSVSSIAHPTLASKAAPIEENEIVSRPIMAKAAAPSPVARTAPAGVRGPAPGGSMPRTGASVSKPAQSIAPPRPASMYEGQYSPAPPPAPAAGPPPPPYASYGGFAPAPPPPASMPMPSVAAAPISVLDIVPPASPSTSLSQRSSSPPTGLSTSSSSSSSLSSPMTSSMNAAMSSSVFFSGSTSKSAFMAQQQQNQPVSQLSWPQSPPHSPQPSPPAGKLKFHMEPVHPSQASTSPHAVRSSSISPRSVTMSSSLSAPTSASHPPVRY